MRYKKLSFDYLAGLFDGEGHASVRWQGKDDKRLKIQMSITSTTYSIIAILQNNFGGSVVLNGDKRPNRKQSWRWYLTGWKALEMMKNILEYTVIKHDTIQACLEWEFLDRSFYRARPVTKEALKCRQDLFNKVRNLNK